MIIFILFGLIAIVGMAVSFQLKNKFRNYSKIPIRSGLTGKEIAEKMLRDNNIYDVKVISVEGELTDHYNPKNKTINLSPDVYNGASVAAAAVAAHECGHAIQHALAYSWLELRSTLVPIVSVSSSIIQWILLIGILLVQVSLVPLGIAIVLFALITLFSFITLPVEFDASKRALAWLNQTGLTIGEEHEKATDALKWAAMTYVVAAISSLITLLHYVMVFLEESKR